MNNLCIFSGHSPTACISPGVPTGCLVKDTLKAGSSLREEGYMRRRMKKPAPQQKSTPIVSSSLLKDREVNSGIKKKKKKGTEMASFITGIFSHLLTLPKHPISGGVIKSEASAISQKRTTPHTTVTSFQTSF